MNTTTATTALTTTAFIARASECGDDVVPALLAPRVRRAEKSGRGAWVVECDLDPFECSARCATKREATARLSGEGLRAWLAFAGEVAERGGRSAGVTRQAPRPEAGSQPGPAVSWTRGWAGVGDAIGGHEEAWRVLAEHRLGWPAERLAAALRDSWSRDWTTWVAARVSALEALRAGEITADEELHLGASPSTVGYLRLEEAHCRALSRHSHPLAGEDLRRFYQPGSWHQTSTCWAK